MQSLLTVLWFKCSFETKLIFFIFAGWLMVRLVFVVCLNYKFTYHWRPSVIVTLLLMKLNALLTSKGEILCVYKFVNKRNKWLWWNNLNKHFFQRWSRKSIPLWLLSLMKQAHILQTVQRVNKSLSHLPCSPNVSLFYYLL